MQKKHLSFNSVCCIWHTNSKGREGIPSNFLTTELLLTKQITDYSAANHYFNDLMQDPSICWDHYSNTYRRIAKQLHAQFLQLMPEKEVVLSKKT